MVLHFKMVSNLSLRLESFVELRDCPDVELDPPYEAPYLFYPEE